MPRHGNFRRSSANSLSLLETENTFGTSTLKYVDRATILLASLDFVTKAPKTMKLNTLKDLYIHELKDLYSAEKQIIKALPKMIKAATNQELAAGFQEHLEQTRDHAERLEKILAGYNQSTRGPKCKGMEGLLAGG